MNHPRAPRTPALYLWTFLRGFTIVALLAANTWFIAKAAFLAAFVCSWGLNALWCGNTRLITDARIPGIREAYATGAACGTVVGLWVARLVL